MRKVLLLSLIGLAMVLSINYAIGNLYANKNNDVSYDHSDAGQKQLNEITVSVFPNPLTDERLTIESNTGIVEIEILDIIGKTIYKEVFKNSTSRTFVNFKDYPKGYYIVKISLEGKKFFTEKILYR